MSEVPLLEEVPASLSAQYEELYTKKRLRAAWKAVISAASNRCWGGEIKSSYGVFLRRFHFHV